MSLDPDTIDELRSIAGLPVAKYTTYYNLAGPHRRMAEGRVNGKSKFIIEMNKADYEESLQDVRNQKDHYELLLTLYQEKSKEESDDETD